jgi:hypothetical protein
MSRTTLTSASLLFLTLAAPLGHACTPPTPPSSFPNGATAALPEMLEGQKSVKKFQADMADYRNCIDSENPPAPAGAALTDEQKKAQDAREKARAQKHNEAVAMEEKVAGEFNTQLHAYKDAQAAKKP